MKLMFFCILILIIICIGFYTLFLFIYFLIFFSKKENIFKKNYLFRKLLFLGTFIYLPFNNYNKLFIIENYLNKNDIIQNKELKIADENQFIEKNSYIKQISYPFFINRQINLYFHVFNKKSVVQSFLKNIFVFNFDYFLQELFKDNNNNFPIIKIILKEFNITNNDVFIKLKFIHNNDLYEIKNEIRINDLLKFENHFLKLKIPILKNDEIFELEFNFINFKIYEIKTVFDYDIYFEKVDISEIDKTKISNYFMIFELIPENIIYSKNKSPFGLNVKSISYKVNNGIQEFDLVYNGNQDFSIKKLDLKIDVKNLDKFNIFNFDESAIDEVLYIGETIKKIKYTTKITKDFYKNYVFLKINLLNILDKNLLFFDELNDIKKEHELLIDFSTVNFIKIDVKEEIKKRFLPINITSNDIELISSDVLNNVSILSIKIIEFNNEYGYIKLKIVYSYKNALMIEKIDQTFFEINDLSFFRFNDKKTVTDYVKNNFFNNNNNFCLEKFKLHLINSDNSWLFLSKNVDIVKDKIELFFNNQILNINFYIKNIENKILWKTSISLDFELSTKSKKEFHFYYICIVLSLILLIIFISFIIYLIIKKRKKLN